MKNNNYHTSIEVSQSPKEVFNALKNVSNWWSTEFEGNSAKLNDEFIIHHPGMHYSKQKLVEVIPDKKIVWLVTESSLDWLKNDKQEWTNTKMIFEIESKDHHTILHFTHEGLLPEKECYAMCEKGWNLIINDWLFHLITVGSPSAEMSKAAEIRNQHFGNKTDHKNYHKSIVVNASKKEALKKISEVVWWKEDFTGSAEKMGDTFTVPFGEPSFVDFVVSGFIPDERVAWKVTDCFLPWFQNKKEWNDTEVVFDLSEEGGKTKIDFTHIGLVPEAECYEVCEEGWNGHIENLQKFIG
jgi:hypothetical protein